MLPDEMRSDSVEAYDLPERVRTYDADMDIMHPLRGKMIEVALEILPFQQSQPLRTLDLGVGTGVFSKRLLEKDRVDAPTPRVTTRLGGRRVAL